MKPLLHRFIKTFMPLTCHKQSLDIYILIQHCVIHTCFFFDTNSSFACRSQTHYDHYHEMLMQTTRTDSRRWIKEDCRPQMGQALTEWSAQNHLVTIRYHWWGHLLNWWRIVVIMSFDQTESRDHKPVPCSPDWCHYWIFISLTRNLNQTNQTE